MHWPKEAELMGGGCLMQLWTHLKEVIRNMEECLAYSVNAPAASDSSLAIFSHWGTCGKN